METNTKIKMKNTTQKNEPFPWYT